MARLVDSRQDKVPEEKSQCRNPKAVLPASSSLRAIWDNALGIIVGLAHFSEYPDLKPECWVLMPFDKGTDLKLLTKRCLEIQDPLRERIRGLRSFETALPFDHDMAAQVALRIVRLGNILLNYQGEGFMREYEDFFDWLHSIETNLMKKR